MDAFLITLGSLGLGAILISSYLLLVAARNYAIEEPGKRCNREYQKSYKLVPRSDTDRRSDKPVVFPLTVNGILITQDRRTQSDRRIAA